MCHKSNREIDEKSQSRKVFVLLLFAEKKNQGDLKSGFLCTPPCLHL